MVIWSANAVPKYQNGVIALSTAILAQKLVDNRENCRKT
jgi:hypothetical protein